MVFQIEINSSNWRTATKTSLHYNQIDINRVVILKFGAPELEAV